VPNAGFVRASKQLVTCSGDHLIRVWDVASGEDLYQLKGGVGPVSGFAVSTDGRLVAASYGGTSTIWVWDLKARKVLRKLEGHENRVRCLAISVDGAFLVSGSDDATARVWRLSK
jgi:WD40 repeat protein